ncbi:MAG: hypothetical protein WA323_00890 [Candidatus Nitrosopolaris sp.]
MPNTAANMMVTEARYIGKSGNRNAKIYKLSTSSLAIRNLDMVIKQRRKGGKCNPTLQGE